MWLICLVGQTGPLDRNLLDLCRRCRVVGGMARRRGTARVSSASALTTSPTPKPSRMAASVSVAVPTLNEASGIGALLESVHSQQPIRSRDANCGWSQQRWHPRDPRRQPGEYAFYNPRTARAPRRGRSADHSRRRRPTPTAARAKTGPKAHGARRRALQTLVGGRPVTAQPMNSFEEICARTLLDDNFPPASSRLARRSSPEALRRARHRQLLHTDATPCTPSADIRHQVLQLRGRHRFDVPCAGSGALGAFYTTQMPLWSATCRPLCPPPHQKRLQYGMASSIANITTTASRLTPPCIARC